MRDGDEPSSLRDSWDEEGWLSGADDDDISTDLRALLLSIEGECKALRSAPSFRTLEPAPSAERSGSSDDDTCGSESDGRACGRSPAKESDPTKAASGPNANLVTLLDEIEGNCRSFRCGSGASLPAPAMVKYCDSDGGSPTEQTSGDDVRCPQDSNFDDDTIGSLIVVTCSVRSSVRRKKKSMRKAGSARCIARKREDRPVTRRALANNGVEVCNIAEIMPLIPEELRSKVYCPVEV